MNRLYALLLALIYLPVFTPAQTANHRILFVANLNGGQEVPANNSDARGVVTFLVSDDRTTLSIHGVFSGLSGPVTGCHIHNAPEAVSGPVYLALTSQISGNRLHAEVPVPADFISKALTENLYLNVHTAANPNGEIRGQLFLKSDELFGTALDGASQVPPVTTDASGIFKFTYSPGQAKGQYFCVVDGLSGPITAAHLHDAAAGANGPVYLPLTVVSNNTLAGEISFTDVPSDFLGKLESNGLYVNIHTAANPNGEIRGQVHSPGRFLFDAVLNGDQQVPAVTTSALGMSVVALTPNLDTMVYKVTFQGLTPTAAHFHRSAAGSNGPVAVPLTQSNYPNFYAGRVAVAPDFVSDLIAGNVYVNIHTAAHPNGEIRGQVQPLLRTVYAFDLCGGQEVPPTGSAAEGAAVISLSRLNTHMDYLYIVDGLSGPATAAHIHDGAVGAGGPVYLPVFAPSPMVGSGQFEITGDDFLKLESGNTYLNVHTAAFPAGEVRGQVGRELLCAANTATQEPVAAQVFISPNPASGQALLRMSVREAFEGQLVLSNSTGQIVQLQKTTFEAGEQTLSLDVAQLPAGLYFIQIRSAEGWVQTCKLLRE